MAKFNQSVGFLQILLYKGNKILLVIMSLFHKGRSSGSLGSPAPVCQHFPVSLQEASAQTFSSHDIIDMLRKLSYSNLCHCRVDSISVARSDSTTVKMKLCHRISNRVVGYVVTQFKGLNNYKGNQFRQLKSCPCSFSVGSREGKIQFFYRGKEKSGSKICQIFCFGIVWARRAKVRAKVLHKAGNYLATYNLRIQVHFIMLSNGIKRLCRESITSFDTIFDRVTDIHSSFVI